MYIKVRDLQEGMIVQEDVMGMTNYPIIPKNTALTNLHIKFLNSFLIKGIDVFSGEGAGTDAAIPVENTIEEESPETVSLLLSKDHFIEMYSHSVECYKKEFQKWQSGMGIDIIKIREIIVPLAEYVIKHTEKLADLQNYSTKTDYLFHHAVSVGLLSAAIADKQKRSKGEVIQAALAGVLADCGMSKVNPSVLTKTSPLNEKEYKEMTNHPMASYNMVKEILLLKPEAKLAVFQHHERMDGTGYLMKEKAERIHYLSQIVAVADTYHAMTSERLYRNREASFKVLEMIREDLFGKFDIKTVDALISLLAAFSLGTKVKLSNQEVGTVMFIKQQHPTRPLVNIEGEGTIDLEKRRDIYIEAILK
ncbi:HD-GYP domain-containing protein (c-di-GMP phosphodiesterase class II) [Bacillus ectoiniformans]|uniref:HD-GYP domain-containing protein n=1 Tax=Bacillus ectoiniformans TaxID=1494429 RepID=UPI001958F8BA|nr:HD-GYP domain-containing protein [Bacillus ectoiniformans]MBM7648128.1 HD-GYP domain-containing protein (c-di-GMP phosphodiesterase class II) [Bacillus ectoiniformans]